MTTTRHQRGPGEKLLLYQLLGKDSVGETSRGCSMLWEDMEAIILLRSLGLTQLQRSGIRREAVSMLDTTMELLKYLRQLLRTTALISYDFSKPHISLCYLIDCKVNFYYTSLFNTMKIKI